MRRDELLRHLYEGVEFALSVSDYVLKRFFALAGGTAAACAGLDGALRAFFLIESPSSAPCATEATDGSGASSVLGKGSGADIVLGDHREAIKPMVTGVPSKQTPRRANNCYGF